eukprot:6597726-Prymnesium_polylepis.1
MEGLTRVTQSENEVVDDGRTEVSVSEVDTPSDSDVAPRQSPHVARREPAGKGRVPPSRGRGAEPHAASMDL